MESFEEAPAHHPAKTTKFGTSAKPTKASSGVPPQYEEEEKFAAPSQKLEDFVTKAELPEGGEMGIGSTGETSDLYREHLMHTLQALEYLRNTEPPGPEELKDKMVSLPPPRKSHISKTLVIDLDETLAHCVDDIATENPQFVLPITFVSEEGDKGGEVGEVIEAGINLRPHAIESLRSAAENFQIVVFTASHRAYADVVLDFVDPRGEIIDFRLYRESCVVTSEGMYIKDLRIFENRDLKDVVIVDNAVYSFGFQLDNGVPIIPYYDNPHDEELLHLSYYLKCLANCDDVREQNR